MGFKRNRFIRLSLLFLYLKTFVYSEVIIKIGELKIDSLNNKIDYWGKIIEGIALGLPLFIVTAAQIWILKRDKKDADEMSRNKFWFRNLILEKNLEEIRGYFASLIEINKKYQESISNEDLDKLLDLQEVERKKVFHFTEVLKIYSEELDEEISKLSLQANDLSLEEKKEKEILDIKNKILKILYYFEKNNYKYVKDKKDIL